MSGVTLAYRVDDVVVRRQFPTASQALRVFDAVTSGIHTHWVIVRDRATGSSWFWRAK